MRQVRSTVAGPQAVPGPPPPPQTGPGGHGGGLGARPLGLARLRHRAGIPASRPAWGPGSLTAPVPCHETLCSKGSGDTTISIFQRQSWSWGHSCVGLGLCIHFWEAFCNGLLCTSFPLRPRSAAFGFAANRKDQCLDLRDVLQLCFSFQYTALVKGLRPMCLQPFLHAFSEKPLSHAGVMHGIASE